MSEVKSYRFNENTTLILNCLQTITKKGEKEIIEAALDFFWNKAENIDKNIVLDFHDNLFGINNSEIEKFINSLPKAGYMIDHYGNGDRLVIKKKN